jgi:two-component system response regulator MprA
MTLLTLKREVSEFIRSMLRYFDELLAASEPSERRENGALDTIDDSLLTFSDLTMNLRTRDVRRGRRLIELTRTEFRLLELFLRNPRQVLTRELIFERVWGFDFGPTSNTLSVYVGYLRRKTEASGEPRVIHTIRGVGYMLRE